MASAMCFRLFSIAHKISSFLEIFFSAFFLQTKINISSVPKFKTFPQADIFKVLVIIMKS